jgi:hypothetical protein
VPDYFTTLHGVMKFEKEPSAFKKNRRSLLLIAKKIADRQPSPTSEKL